MSEVEQVAAQAKLDIRKWLDQHPETIAVQNVESVSDYQRRAIDLLWHTQQGTYKIQVNADLWDQSGNFFFETDSNVEKGTPGCFLYTKAQYIFYYFVKTKVLYILPMPETREWFLPRLGTFFERPATKPAAEGGTCLSLGRLIPIRVVLASVPNIEEVQLD